MILQHDPQTKLRIKQILFEFIYGPLKKHFKARLDEIIIQNTLKGKYSHAHFMYKGKLYDYEPPPFPVKKNLLLIEFRPQMEDYLRDFNKIHQEELPLTLGYITQVLNTSNHFCDYYKLLPEVLHAPIKEFAESCPCKTSMLPEAQVEAILEKNTRFVDLLEQRLALNCLY